MITMGKIRINVQTQNKNYFMLYKFGVMVPPLVFSLLVQSSLNLTITLKAMNNFAILIRSSTSQTYIFNPNKQNYSTHVRIQRSH